MFVSQARARAREGALRGELDAAAATLAAGEARLAAAAKAAGASAEAAAKAHDARAAWETKAARAEAARARLAEEARQDFAEHFHTLECGHRPSQVLDSADRIPAPLH